MPGELVRRPEPGSLEHYGVKGMRWGRKSAGDKGSSDSPRVTRKQNRQMNREARKKFDQKKADAIIGEAIRRGDNVLIKTLQYGDSVPTIVTGKEFTNHMARGGAMNVRATEVYARRNSDKGQFEINDKVIGSYKKQNFRKP